MSIKFTNPTTASRFALINSQLAVHDLLRELRH